MSASAGTAGAGGTKGRTRLGIAAQVVAVIGIAICLALAVGLWLGRGWAVDQVDGVVSSLDERLAKASGAAELVSGRVDAIAADVTQTVAEARAAASDRVQDSERLQRLVGRVSGAIDRYRELRASYAELREKAASAIETLQRLDRLLPGFSVPEGPIDALAALDARIAEIDAAVSLLASAVDGTGPADQLAERISAAGDKAAAAVGAVTGALDGVAGRIDGLRADIAALGGQLRSVLLLGTIGATLVLLYIALLNMALWSLGRHWRREAV
jgi:methyl-accepting chemotaxis protein